MIPSQLTDPPLFGFSSGAAVFIHMGSARLLHSVCSTWDQSTEKHRHLFIGYVAGMSCLEPETTTFFWSFEKDHFFWSFQKNTVVSSYSHFLYEKYGRFMLRAFYN